MRSESWLDKMPRDRRSSMRCRTSACVRRSGVGPARGGTSGCTPAGGAPAGGGQAGGGPAGGGPTGARPTAPAGPNDGGPEDGGPGGAPAGCGSADCGPADGRPVAGGGAARRCCPEGKASARTVGRVASDGGTARAVPAGCTPTSAPAGGGPTGGAAGGVLRASRSRAFISVIAITKRGTCPLRSSSIAPATMSTSFCAMPLAFLCTSRHPGPPARRAGQPRLGNVSARVACVPTTASQTPV